MNKANLKRTRALMDANPKPYRQDSWAHTCGTPACVAGYAVVACGGTIVDADHCIVPALFGDHKRHLIQEAATCLLDLDFDESCAMFASDPFEPDFADDYVGYRASVDDAIAMLDCAIENGTVEWSPEWERC